MKSKHILLGLALLLVLALAACSSNAPAPAQPAAAQSTQAPLACPTAPACPEPPAPVEPVVKDVPFQDQWANSPHNDTTAEAFNHWNEEDPKEVPVECATCHSTAGYQDFVGADGSAAGTVEKPAEIGQTIQCVACHNPATATMTSVKFPSGAEVTGLGAEARCMVCHQGRESKVSVDAAIEKVAVADVDTVSADLGFRNIHYYAAAATVYGTIAKGGYEYEGKTYDSKNDHVEGYDTCIGCHNSHTLELKVEQCAACHQGVASQDDLKNIRMAGSLVDYDGDGDTKEGIAAEIEGLQGMLMTGIQSYAKEVSGKAIAYDPARYPYFMIDANEDGAAGEDEGDRYDAWTARLLKAAYNYQTSVKDPGSYAHGGKYIIELLYDSIEDLNAKLGTPVDLATAHREDAGHFAGSNEQFRHWDAEGVVPGDCAKCHSASGLPTFLDEASRARDGVSGVNIAAHPSNGLNCASCHNDLNTFTRFEVAKVKFPSGKVLDSGNMDSNLCLNCHQGRESKVSVDAAIGRAGAADDEVSDKLSFRNPHYFAAGATLMGNESQGAYEYAGQEYNGRLVHAPNFNTCTNCHDAHALTVKTEACTVCHGSVKTQEDLATIRMSQVDFDGDGDLTEGMAGEVATMTEALYKAIQDYATAKAGAGIAYDAHAYPYFFTDTNANGALDEDEANSDNSFKTWTPRLLKAAYNYQWVQKDPGAYAHNGQYILQVLYDSIKDVGGNVSGMTRPEVKVPPAP